MRHRSHQPVQSVTAVPTSRADEISARTRNYLISMAIRSVSLVAAVIATGPLRWTFVASAVLLPYFAVVVANAGRRRSGPGGPQAVLPFEKPALESGRPVDDGPAGLRDDAAAPGGDGAAGAAPRG